MKFKKYLYFLIIFLFSPSLSFGSEKAAFLDIDYILNNYAKVFNKNLYLDKRNIWDQILSHL